MGLNRHAPPPKKLAAASLKISDWGIAGDGRRQVWLDATDDQGNDVRVDIMLPPEAPFSIERFRQPAEAVAA
jgi:hypothetical protein